MSIALIKQNSQILLEVAQNYEKLINNSNKQSSEYELHLKNFRNQFLYLLSGLHKLLEQEKNAK